MCVVPSTTRVFSVEEKSAFTEAMVQTENSTLRGIFLRSKLYEFVIMCCGLANEILSQFSLQMVNNFEFAKC